jgi:aspartate aminotransferase-like enzyme
MRDKSLSIGDFVTQQNDKKLLFTAGPASLLPENITGLRPCFGRGDEDFAAVEERVMSALQQMSGHSHLVRMQGSASLALEIMALNFLYGRVLVVQSGYYSDRLTWLSDSAKRRLKAVKEVQRVEWDALDTVSGSFDWVFACYTETSCGLKIPIEMLRSNADRLGAKLMLDATASIGLEDRHDLADVIAYSSCKGLFGLTGAAFVAYHESPTTEVDSFYLDIASHIHKKMTGPYHAIASLDEVLRNHASFRFAVEENKRLFQKCFARYLTVPNENQPFLCTHLSCKIKTEDPRAVLYAPRSDKGGSVVCHLGEVHLQRSAQGVIQNVLQVEA